MDDKEIIAMYFERNENAIRETSYPGHIRTVRLCFGSAVTGRSSVKNLRNSFLILTRSKQKNW